MKKITLLVLFITSMASAQIVNIPDANFRNRLITLGVDINSDGQIQVSEATAVTGTLDVSGNNISDLTGIEAFVNITVLNSNQNMLTSLDVSSNTALLELRCVQNQITTLNVSANLNLQILEAWGNPLDDIDLVNCPSLVRLGLSGTNLVTLDCNNNTNLIELFIAGNQFLETVFIKNGSDESSGNIDGGSWQENWDFGNNPNLLYVCADDDQVLEIQGFAGTNYVVNSYCSFEPGGDYNTITGIAQLDINDDGCDTGDAVIPFMSFNVGLDPDPADGSVYTGTTGAYNLYVGETGTYSITANLENPSYYTVSPSPASVSIPVINNSIIVQDFCVTANGVVADAEVVIAPIFPSRPGFDATYQLVYKNKGNETLSGTVNFEYDDTVLDFISASTMPDTQSTGVLSFDFDGLLPFESRFVDIIVNVNDPTETPPVNIDDVLDFTAEIAIDQTEETPDDNTFDYTEIVIGSFDPNDITCLQGDIAPSTLIGDYLHYVINFENTGNAPAENVVVTTQIDPTDFDVNTLQILNASHEMSLSVTGDFVEFVFEDVNLSSGGHGNILMKIRTNIDLVTTDFVAADAAIYFDFNFPITTNTASTTFETLSVDEFSTTQQVLLYPNPSDAVLTIETTSNMKTIHVYDMQGRSILSTEVSGQTTAIDISTFANGVYFVTVKTDIGEITKRVLKR
ncbi:T9SS type A sorting domain-containing protein [uncultured Dokdonia sp.]|uniref:DUF7619 domain-containing protein n=1 Tax=uncultured Dokdonia sp. TaxID=575653 RepID=UPI002608DEF9|nr:T9SS type A sorting domain-containing protein [uncultured Dokdonia sp.]